MHADKFSKTIERNIKLVNAIERALLVMRLTDGCTINMLGICGRLNFEREMEEMVQALRLLGADGSLAPLATPAGVALSRPH